MVFSDTNLEREKRGCGKTGYVRGGNEWRREIMNICGQRRKPGSSKHSVDYNTPCRNLPCAGSKPHASTQAGLPKNWAFPSQRLRIRSNQSAKLTEWWSWSAEPWRRGRLEELRVEAAADPASPCWGCTRQTVPRADPAESPAPRPSCYPQTWLFGGRRR